MASRDSAEVKIGDYDYSRWTLTEILRTNLAQRPGRMAVRSAEESYTYQELWDEACRLAFAFHEAGIKAGDRVLTMMDNSGEWAICLAALNFVGAVGVPVNVMYRGSILAHVVRDSQATAAVVEHSYLETLTSSDDGLLGTLIVRGGERGDVISTDRPTLSFSDLRAGRKSLEPVATHPWDGVLVGYTSGTTGNSKGVLITQAHLVSMSDPDSIQKMTKGDDEVVYIATPLFHALGSGAVVAAWILGGEAHIAPRFSASTFIEDATKVGATHTYLVAAMADFLLQQPRRESDAQCSIVTAYLNPVHSKHREFTERFGIAIRSSYGSTEIGGAIATGADIEAIERRSCGKPRPGVTIRLVDDNDLEIPVGQTGECVVRHQYPWTLCAEYIGNPAATAAGWRNGWFHTGDLLRQDEDGYYYFVDRKKDAIRRRGENVSSVEVEREVLAHPDVVDCAVVAVDLAEFEQEIKVFAVCRTGTTLSEEVLAEFLADRLPRFAVPRFVQFIDELPRTPTQKIRKQELRARANDECWDRAIGQIVVPK
ncbi:AMP-binding protein [Rhodococcus sp. MSC1_016]|jgi:crotonobetaine/carnitine-CoA ligase|uniref:AMP-binding protein n=1 Tax=Rhodococcus sp. MSC1_016 TaxID=2909266 RepID=UPI00202F63F2|nr:AMP-binding protein [Rhodococcus sp. MSC1_016]